MLSRQQLLQRVWEYDVGDERLVDVHVGRLRQKIEDGPGDPGTWSPCVAWATSCSDDDAGLRTGSSRASPSARWRCPASMAFVSYELTRAYLLDDRERTALRAAVLRRRGHHRQPRRHRPDVVDVLRSLDTGGNRRAVLHRDGRWYTRNADPGTTAAVPAELRGSSPPGGRRQRVRVDGGPALVIGVPLSATTTLTRSTPARAGPDAAGPRPGADHRRGRGRRGRRRPRLVRDPARAATAASVADAAEEIAAGDLTARLDPATEPDLARLTTSFNQMVDQLARRIERDRRFAADVSHELRSPLQTLAAAASVLHRRREHLDARTATAAGLVADEIERFQRLVTDLIELARSDQPADLPRSTWPTLARRACHALDLPADLVDLAPGTRRDVAGRAAADRADPGEPARQRRPPRRRRGRGSAIGAAERGVVEVDDEGPGVAREDREVDLRPVRTGRVAEPVATATAPGSGSRWSPSMLRRTAGGSMVADRPGGGARFRVDLPGSLS